MTSNKVPPDQRELTGHIYWNSLLFESNLLAEFDLLYSNIIQFEKNIDLPEGFEEDE